MKNNPFKKHENENSMPAGDKPRFNFSLFAIVFLGIVCYVCLCRINAYSNRLTNLHEPQAEKTLMESHMQNDPEIWGEVARYARNLNRFFIYHRNFYAIPDSEKVTSDDLIEDMAIINRNLNIGLENAAEEYNKTILDPTQSYSQKEQAEEVFESNVAKLLENYSFEMESAKTARLRDRISNYFAIENYLDTTMEFAYIINDAVLERSFSNVSGSSDLDNYTENEIYINIDISKIFDTFNGIPLSDSYAQNGITGFIMIPKDQPAGSIIQSGIDRVLNLKTSQINFARAQVNGYTVVLCICLVLIGLITFKSMTPHVNSVKNGSALVLQKYMKIPFTLKFILAIFSVSGIMEFFTWPFEISVSLYSHEIVQTILNIFSTYAAVILIILLGFYIIWLFQGKHKFSKEVECQFIWSLINSIKIMRKFSPVFMPMLSLWLLLVALIFVFFGFYIIISIGLEPSAFLIAALCLAFSFFICLVALILVSYTKLSYYIKNLSEGNLVEIPEESDFLSSPINALNRLSEGLKITLNEMVSAERTKTELITNVSHDLKTPLTSIINYVSLLKESRIEDPAIREYVNILEQKSDRLRVLIEDLFEASKLSSRSMALSYESVDVVQLLSQAIGEMSEKFENKNMEIRFKPSEQKIMVMLDGQRMWRVFENLLNNIVNYSPAGSRAYITLTDNETGVEITMKNISSFELDFDANELFERFKRGDAARTTEGSGLGLSISKDIVELHNGKMDIFIDGDLFKVVVFLNKSAAND